MFVQLISDSLSTMELTINLPFKEKKCSDSSKDEFYSYQIFQYLESSYIAVSINKKNLIVIPNVIQFHIYIIYIRKMS